MLWVGTTFTSPSETDLFRLSLWELLCRFPTTTLSLVIGWVHAARIYWAVGSWLSQNMLTCINHGHAFYFGDFFISFPSYFPARAGESWACPSVIIWVLFSTSLLSRARESWHMPFTWLYFYLFPLLVFLHTPLRLQETFPFLQALLYFWVRALSKVSKDWDHTSRKLNEGHQEHSYMYPLQKVQQFAMLKGIWLFLPFILTACMHIFNVSCVAIV